MMMIMIAPQAQNLRNLSPLRGRSLHTTQEVRTQHQIGQCTLTGSYQETRGVDMWNQPSFPVGESHRVRPVLFTHLTSAYLPQKHFSFLKLNKA